MASGDRIKRRQLLQWFSLGTLAAVSYSLLRSRFQGLFANSSAAIATDSVSSQGAKQVAFQSAQSICLRTPPDMMGPFYVPNAPIRSKIGEGHILRGKVRSSGDCKAIANARIEFWQTGPAGEYGDNYRATVFSSEAGEYQFESNFPLPYASRPPHIHIRISADGYETLVTQYYPSDGQTSSMFDLVL